MLGTGALLYKTDLQSKTSPLYEELHDEQSPACKHAKSSCPAGYTMTDPIELGLVDEARLEARLHGGIVAYNPTIELFAAAAGPETLQIWRMNNQIVAQSSQRGERVSVQAVRWKPDGRTSQESAVEGSAVQSSANASQASFSLSDGAMESYG